MVTLAARQSLLQTVQAALPQELAASLTSAGIEGSELRLGASTGGWATRLRYVASAMRGELSEILGVKIERVKIRVVRAAGA